MKPVVMACKNPGPYLDEDFGKKNCDASLTVSQDCVVLKRHTEKKVDFWETWYIFR